MDGYVQEVRDAVGKYVAVRRDQGATWSALENDVGISSTSLRTWMRALPDGGFHQIVVVDDPPMVGGPVAELVITSPSGFRLTGCSLEQATVVLQRVR